MRERIAQEFERSTPEIEMVIDKIEMVIDMIEGICQSRSVSSTALSRYIRGEAEVESKQRRIERLYQRGLRDEGAIQEGIYRLLGGRKFDISIDRSNWKYGRKHVNALAAFASDGNIGGLIGLTMLDSKCGNSSSSDRIEIMQEIINRFGKDKIRQVAGDREFFSFEFASWLCKEEIPFVFRIKENMEFVQPYLVQAKRGGKVIKNVEITMPDVSTIKCDLSLKTLNNEYLILLSYKVKNPLISYRKRWEIETFFKMLKTGGFNIESTKMTHPKRLTILFLLCAFAYLICVLLGDYRHKFTARMRRKRKINASNLASLDGVLIGSNTYFSNPCTIYASL